MTNPEPWSESTPPPTPHWPPPSAPASPSPAASFPPPPPPAQYRRPPRPRPWWGCGDIFIGIGLVLVTSLVFGVPLALANVTDGLLFEAISAASVWIALGGWSLVACWLKGTGSLKLDFGWAFRWFDPFLGIGLAFLTILIGAGLDAVQQSIGVEAATNTGFLQDAADRGFDWTYFAFLLIVGVGAPLVEELFFRGLTFSALQKRFNGLVAVIGSSLIFGLLHFQPGDVVPTVFFLVNITTFGLVLGTARYLSKRTGPGVFAHMAFNLTAALTILLTATR